MPSHDTHLKGGYVHISLIQTTAQKNLIRLLEKCPGPKAIVWDNFLVGLIDLITQKSILVNQGVTKMFPLRPTPLPEADVAHIIFITRPKLHLMDYVGHNVRAKTKTKKQYHVFFVSKKSLLCLERLKRNGIFESINLMEEFQCELFPFDADVVSMEITDVFREYALENDPTYLYQTAQAIIFLQKLYGPIPKVWGKGAAARQVWEFVTRLQREKSNEPITRTNQTSTIDQIILIDRSVDLLTPLVTQLTYEGLIDEIFGINNSTANFPIDNFVSSKEHTSESLSEDKKQIILNSADKLFANIRDKNFNAVGAFLSQEARTINAQVDNRQELSIREMKFFVRKLPQITSKKKNLSLHIAIAEYIKEATDSYDFLNTVQTEQEFLNCIAVDKASPYIEDLIAHAKPLVQVLRLICLQCITSSGFKPKVLEHYKRELVQVYGIQAFLAIMKLEKVGLLKAQSGSRQYTDLRRALHLTIEDTSEINPSDISYVHSIYAPLSVRLVEQVTKNVSANHLQDVLGLLPGPTLDEFPAVPNTSAQKNSKAPRVVLVFFIGGCTFAEISALRFLSQQEDSSVKFVIATTKLINGTSFLKSIIEL